MHHDFCRRLFHFKSAELLILLLLLFELPGCKPKKVVIPALPQSSARPSAVDTEDSVRLEITSTGRGFGTVDWLEGPQRCFSSSLSCLIQVLPGARVTLRANPAPDAVFRGFNLPECAARQLNCTFVANENMTVEAPFDADPIVTPVTVTLLRQGDGAGTVTSQWGHVCFANDEKLCTVTIAQKSMLLLTAQSDADAFVDGFAGYGCAPWQPSCAFSPRESDELKVTFLKGIKSAYPLSTIDLNRVFAQPTIDERAFTLRNLFLQRLAQNSQRLQNMPTKAGAPLLLTERKHVAIQTLRELKKSVEEERDQVRKKLLEESLTQALLLIESTLFTQIIDNDFKHLATAEDVEGAYLLMKSVFEIEHPLSHTFILHKWAEQWAASAWAVLDESRGNSVLWGENGYFLNARGQKYPEAVLNRLNELLSADKVPLPGPVWLAVDGKFQFKVEQNINKTFKSLPESRPLAVMQKDFWIQTPMGKMMKRISDDVKAGLLKTNLIPQGSDPNWPESVKLRTATVLPLYGDVSEAPAFLHDIWMPVLKDSPNPNGSRNFYIHGVIENRLSAPSTMRVYLFLEDRSWQRRDKDFLLEIYDAKTNSPKLFDLSDVK